jgi:hypothetical protein
MSPAFALTLALAATPSASELGIVAAANDTTTDQVLAASRCPRVVVFPVPGDGSATSQFQAYKASCPTGIAIARVGNANAAVDDTTVTTFGGIWMSQVAALGTTPAPDAVEGPSEPSAVSAAALASFWSAFANLVHGAGLRPVVGAVGPGALLGPTDAFCPTADALKAKGIDWWWSFHTHSVIQQDATAEAQATFGFRKIRTDCAGIGTVPVVVSEVAPANGAWIAADGPWLAFLDAQLATDANFIGAALTPNGRDQIATDLLNALANGPATPDGGVPDGGVDGGAGVVQPGSDGPGGPLTPVHTKGGCASGGAGLAALGILPVLFALRRRSTPLSPRPSPCEGEGDGR